MLTAFSGRIPNIDATTYIQQSAQVIGDVVIGAYSSVWFNVVVRGDGNRIRIGQRTNIQDSTVIHVATDKWPTIIGNEVTVGHAAILHGCTIASRCLIGMGAIVMDGAEVGDDCIIAAGALVVPGMKVPARCLVVGSPGRVMRDLRPEELEQIRQSAQNYVDLSRKYLAEGIH